MRTPHDPILTPYECPSCGSQDNDQYDGSIGIESKFTLECKACHTIWQRITRVTTINVLRGPAPEDPNEMNFLAFQRRHGLHEIPRTESETTEGDVWAVGWDMRVRRGKQSAAAACYLANVPPPTKSDN